MSKRKQILCKRKIEKTSLAMHKIFNRNKRKKILLDSHRYKKNFTYQNKTSQQ